MSDTFVLVVGALVTTPLIPLYSIALYRAVKSGERREEKR